VWLLFFQEERQQKAIDNAILLEMETLAGSAPFLALEAGEDGSSTPQSEAAVASAALPGAGSRMAPAGTAPSAAASGRQLVSLAGVAAAALNGGSQGRAKDDDAGSWEMPVGAQTLSDVEDGELEEVWLPPPRPK